jgi:hypothetical protein
MYLRPLKITSRLAFIALVFSLSPTDLFADESQRVWRSAYYSGRGDTGIATADYEDAIFYNPAGIAKGKGIYKKTVFGSPFFEVSQATRDIVRQVSTEGQATLDVLRSNIGKPQHVGFYNYSGFIFRRFAVGAFASQQTNFLVSKSHLYGGLETLDLKGSTNAGLAISLAETFFKDIHMGITYKYFANRLEYSFTGEDGSIADFASGGGGSISPEEFAKGGTGNGVDFGMMYKAKLGRNDLHLGMQIENLGTTVFAPFEVEGSSFEGEAPTPLAQQVNIGAALDINTRLSSLRMLMDLRDITSTVDDNNLKKIHIGFELNVKELVGFTAGLNDGYIASGLYADIYLARLDIGSYTVEYTDRVGVRPDRRYFMKLTMGL